MINFLINWQDVNNGVLAALRMLLLKLCEPIYSLIVFCFDIFEDFGELRLFEGSDTISMIYNRVGLILGLFMVFRITFTAIEYLVDPDKILDSKQGIGNIIKKVLIVVILLGSTRYIFNFAFDFQSKLIESDVVGNLILGPSYIEENKYSAGTNLAWFTFTQFYTLNDRAKNDNNYENCRIMLSSGNGAEANSGGSIYNDFHDNHKFNNAEYCLNLKTNDKYSIDSNVKEKQELNIIDFSGFICLAVGAVLLWIIMTYTVQVAVRVFQLAYLELIAPIPIMMYLMPNGDEKLKKWAQQCLTTFLDFFIRLAIMDFIILVSSALVELEDTDSMLVTFNKLSFWGSGYVKIILIIALFAFVKKVPELLKELFPSIGGTGFDFGLHGKSAKRIGTIAGGALAGGAVGLIGGHGIVGRAKGLVGGIGQGAISGAKGKKISEISAARAKRNKINRQASLNGSTFGGRLDARMRNMFGFETASEGIDRRISAIDEQIEAIDNSPNMRTKRQNDAIIGARKAALEEAKSQLLKENGTYSNAGLKADRDKLSYLRAHLGEKDSNGHTITTGMIQAQETLYNTSLDNASRQFIDQHATDNAEIARQMQIIENNAGTPITNFAQMDAADNAAKSSNTAIARDVEAAEHDKQDLNEQKRQLNEQKRIPQANENAINNK